YGRRPILMSSLAGACVSYVLLGCAPNVWWLLASRMLAGFMAGNIAAAFAYASDVSAAPQRAATLGLVGAAIGIGFTLGPPLGGRRGARAPAAARPGRPALLTRRRAAPAPARLPCAPLFRPPRAPPDADAQARGRLPGVRAARRRDARRDLLAVDPRID